MVEVQEMLKGIGRRLVRVKERLDLIEERLEEMEVGSGEGVVDELRGDRDGGLSGEEQVGEVEMLGEEK